MKKSSPLAALLLAAVAAFAQGPNTPRSQLINDGRDTYRGWCTGCHNGTEVTEGVWVDEGKGYASSTPPLAYSDFFMAIRLRPASIILNGFSDPITVNGLSYGGNMP